MGKHTLMETARKFKGATASKESRAKYRNAEVWDVRWYNFQTNQWEREGNRRTYKGAYNRCYWLAKSRPHSLFDVYLIPGRALAKANGTSPAAKTDAK